MYRNEDRDQGFARVLSLDLPEHQWRALMELEPEPIAWLRRQISERVEAAEPAGPSEVAQGGNACASGGIS